MIVNLLPWRELRRKRRKKLLLGANACATVSAVLFIVALDYYWMHRIDQQLKRNRSVQAEISNANQAIAKIQQLKIAQQQLLTKLTTIQRIHNNRSTNPKLLAQLMQVTPKCLALDQLERRDDAVKLVGHAKSKPCISKLMRRIERNSWMLKPRLNEIKQENKHLLFELCFSLRNAKDEQ